MDRPHPGISVHHIPVGGGIMGSVFAVGSMLVILLGVPTLWYFLGGAVAAGGAMALVMRFLGRRNVSRLPQPLLRR